MSDTSKSTSKPKAATSDSGATSSKPDTANASESTTSAASNGAAAGGASGKSSRDSVGGASAVHYGFFSNVKTPQYRSGWDEIWAKESSGSKASVNRKKKPSRAREPLSISLDLDDLPADVQAGLAKAARAKLKKSRVNYDSRAKAGAVTWRIKCDVKR